MLWSFYLALLSVPTPEAVSQNQAFWFEQLKSESPDLKINAIDKLGELKNPDSIPKLAEMLEDPDAEVRSHAIRALTRSPRAEALAALQARVPAGQPPKESDPYLAAEIRRSVSTLEALVKAAEEAAAAAKNPAPKAPKSKPSKNRK